MQRLTKRGWTAGGLCIGLVVSAAVYTYQLDRVPGYLTLDEAHFSVHAASLAQSGRNLNGQLLPPLISLDDPEGEPFDLPWGSTYYLPFGIYLIAGALQVLPLSEAAVRTPSALLGGVIGLLIFVSLLSGAGLAALMLSKRSMVRASAAVLAVLMVWQFAVFYREYHGSYRIGSGHVYDPTAFREAAELIIASDGKRAADAVYLPGNFYDVGAKWRFYTTKHDRSLLWHRTKYFGDVTTLTAAPPNAIAVLPQTSASATPPGWSTVGVVKNLMGEPTAVVIRRQP